MKDENTTNGEQWDVWYLRSEPRSLKMAEWVVTGERPQSESPANTRKAWWDVCHGGVVMVEEQGWMVW